MKMREITNNELEQLFANIVEQEPLLAENQINSFLNNLPKPSSGNAVKSFFKFHFNTFLLISSLVLIIASVLIWFISDNQSEEPTVQKSPEKNVVASVIADTIATEPKIIINKEISRNKANEDTVIIDFDTNAGTAIVQTESAISLSDVYKHFEKKPQVFSIQANRDTTIICKEGTTIQISANSFISGKTGNTISGTVQFKVNEYYIISDMILANLTTTSGGEILETGGMLHIAASVNDENCIIEPGRDIKIGFPYSGKKEDMSLFYGEQTNNIIDWKLADKVAPVVAAKEEKQVFFIVEDMPEFPGGELALRKYIADNLKYPVDSAESGIVGKVYVTFIVTKEGGISDANIARGVHPSLDREALRVVNSLPKWKPGKQRGKPVNVSYTIPVNFTLGDSTLTKEEFEKKVKDDNFKETTVSEMFRYLFNVTQLGWINCDKFYNSNNRTIDFFIPTDNSQEIIVNAVFQRFKALIPGKVQSGKITFSNIPEGEKVTIVAIKSVDNKIFLAVKETQETNNGEIKLDFQEVTFELLKNEMEKLNKYY